MSILSRFLTLNCAVCGFFQQLLRWSLVFFLAMGFILETQTARARDPWQTFLAAERASPTHERLITREEAVSKARRRYGGKVLSVRLERPSNQPPYYRIKLLANGDVRIVHIRAEE